MSLEAMSKKDLVKLVTELQTELEKYSNIIESEKRKITGQPLPNKAMGVVKRNNSFEIIELEYDIDTNEAKIAGTKNLFTNSFGALLSQAKIHLGFQILEPLKKQ